MSFLCIPESSFGFTHFPAEYVEHNNNNYYYSNNNHNNNNHNNNNHNNSDNYRYNSRVSAPTISTSHQSQSNSSSSSAFQRVDRNSETIGGECSMETRNESTDSDHRLSSSPSPPPPSYSFFREFENRNQNGDEIEIETSSAKSYSMINACERTQCWIFRLVPLLMLFLVVNCVRAIIFDQRTAFTAINVALGVTLFAAIIVSIFAFIAIQFDRLKRSREPLMYIENHRLAATSIAATSPTARFDIDFIENDQIFAIQLQQRREEEEAEEEEEIATNSNDEDEYARRRRIRLRYRRWMREQYAQQQQTSATDRDRPPAYEQPPTYEQLCARNLIHTNFAIEKN